MGASFMGNMGLPCRRRAINALRAKEASTPPNMTMTFIFYDDVVPKDVFTKPLTNDVKCAKCNKSFKAKGLGKHMSACNFNKKKRRI